MSEQKHPNPERTGAFIKELYARANIYAVQQQRMIVKDTITPGDEYIYVGPGETKLYRCEDRSQFSQALRATDPFATTHVPWRCFKVVPRPAPNMLTIEERLHAIEDKLESLSNLIKQRLLR